MFLLNKYIFSSFLTEPDANQMFLLVKYHNYRDNLKLTFKILLYLVGPYYAGPYWR